MEGPPKVVVSAALLRRLTKRRCKIGGQCSHRRIQGSHLSHDIRGTADGVRQERRVNPGAALVSKQRRNGMSSICAR